MRTAASWLLAVLVTAGCSKQDAESDSGIAVGNGPCCISASSGRIWVLNRRDETLQAINPKTLEVSKPIEVGARQMTAAGGKLFLADTHDAVLSIFDPESLQLLPIDFEGRGAAGMEESRLWVGSSASGEVARVNLTSGEIVERFTVPGVSSFDSMLFTDDGLLWTTTWEGELLRVDLRKRRVVSRQTPFPNAEDYVAIAGGTDAVFAVSGGTSELVFLNAASGEVIGRRPITLGEGVGFPVFSPQPDGTLLLARGADVIDVLDRRTGEPTATYSPPDPSDPSTGDRFFGGAATGFGSLWVGDWTDFDSEGSVARIALR